MPEAYVLVNTEVGSEDEVLKGLKKLKNVKEAYIVYGAYDILARVEADSMNKLKAVTTLDVRKINRVQKTLTMIVTS
ncbi:MAG: Lrp/AsnC ligand binding domain-containing protein [Candidatus Bathyarchaeota archaeon]|jgi:DNA-binding Lrp family transcriptional regulator|nr:MAG: Lrp/AsnC ligand binding domain-containing protein [Candidatus Bathyarchaeota archaeon]